MSLPGLIEIVPMDALPEVTLTVPGSKSITNRALILAALGKGETALEGALWSEDTELMAAALRTLGFGLAVEEDPGEECNRIIRVQGREGKIPVAGTAARPLEIFTGNAGTVARFVAALVCLGDGVYRLQGTPRMEQRPQAPLFRALRSLGYRVDSENDRLPAVIYGSGPRPGECQVSMAESSQFASALLLSARAGRWRVEVVGENREESPYVSMTSELCANFPEEGGRFVIEPDASSGSYFWGVNWLFANPERPLARSKVGVRNWPSSGWQIDAEFPKFWPLRPGISRARDLGDSIMTAIVAAPFAARPVTFTELGSLRVQECERVQALRVELTKCGAKVDEQRDSLVVFPSQLEGAEIETYNDHRMAMCFSMLGMRVPGMRIRDPGCVRKTFPNFFEKLAAPGPRGLGVLIRDAASGKILEGAELRA